MWLEHPAPVVISEGIGEAISDSTDSASPLGSKRGHNRLGRRGIDDFIIGRDPASTVYQAIVPRITAKKVVIREKNRDASIPVVAPDRNPDRNILNDGAGANRVPATSYED